MKFSIITPSFNQGRFLPDCVESVLSQIPIRTSAQPQVSTFNHDDKLAGCAHTLDFEHIVTDAGSTDETLEVLKSYAHIKWTSEPDQGMSDGINKGFLKATGDWLMWLNCDDYLLPGTLEKVAKFITATPKADIVHGDCIYVHEDKSPIRRKLDTPVDEWDLLFVGCCIPSTSAFYRRSIIDSGHLLDLRFRNCMDWEFYLRLIRHDYQFGYLPEALAGFRWYDDSTTKKNWQRMIDEGLLCQREHIRERNLPSLLGNAAILKTLRKTFQIRRVMKRIGAHGKVW